MSTPTVVTPIDKQQIRTQLKTIEKEQFLKASSKNDLIEKAKILGVDTATAEMTKNELYDLMIVAAKLPNAALRGKSSLDEPVAYVWFYCDNLATIAAKGKTEMPKRKDVIAALQKQGVAFYTARTQYQSWFSATDRGKKRVSDLPQDSLPRSMRDEVIEEEGGEDE